MSKEILEIIEFYKENKDSYSKEERVKIKKEIKKKLNKLGKVVIKFIDQENNR